MDHEKNSKQTVQMARGLRKRMSLPEVLLWTRLKPSVNEQFDIRRQHPILSRYVLDFFIPHLQIAIEIDGKHAHEFKEERDQKRQAEIEAIGICFVRIPASWVLRSPSEVTDFILSLCSGEITTDDLDDSLK